MKPDWCPQPIWKEALHTFAELLSPSIDADRHAQADAEHIALAMVAAEKRGRKTALSSLHADGFVVAPKEANVEMIAAFWRQKNAGTQEVGETGADRDDFSAYRAMIAASQDKP